MTPADLLRSSLRRWYVLAAGLALTGAALGYLAIAPGVYWARTNVILLGPPVAARPNKLDSSSAGLIATAGVIEREMNAGRIRIPATSDDVTLVDQGVYDGELVRVPNYGGQWATNFSEPVLDLQASAARPEIVRQRLEQMIDQANDILIRRQDAARVRNANRISIALSPQQVTINYSRGDRSRGMVVATLLGLALSLAAAASVDLIARRRTMDVDKDF